MISELDYSERGWEVVPNFAAGVQLPVALLNEMEAHPEAAGKSSWGTRNLLYSLVLSMRPKIVVEVGAHIGSAAVVIGSALRSNGFGRLYSLEPQSHYFKLLCEHVQKAGVEQYVIPLQVLSTDGGLSAILGEKADMIFLDASHAYSDAFKDIEICDSLIAPNGLILFDDVGPEHSGRIDPEGRGGVRQALLDYCQGREDMKVIFFEPPFWLNPCGLALLCKQSPSSSLSC